MAPKPKHELRQHFTNDHLPEGPMKAASKKFESLASWVDNFLPDGPEKTVCLRKLLEAKDCAVRQAMQVPDGQAAS